MSTSSRSTTSPSSHHPDADGSSSAADAAPPPLEAAGHQVVRGARETSDHRDKTPREQSATVRPRASGRRNALRVSVVLVVVLALVLGAALWGSRGGAGGGQTVAVAVVREDSHRLGEPGTTGVTLTEFLDFECESCRAAYPFVEDLRQEYAGRVTFVVRYFPIPSHANSMTSAIAVEAASQQGQLEPMYRQMYQTQQQWGEQRAATPEVFRAMAQQLGLDMAAFDTAVADPATQRRVQSDYDDGSALGVAGTPTFFVNEQKIQPSTQGEFRELLDAALDRAAAAEPTPDPAGASQP